MVTQQQLHYLLKLAPLIYKMLLSYENHRLHQPPPPPALSTRCPGAAGGWERSARGEERAVRGWEAGDKEKEVLLHARRSSELAAERRAGSSERRAASKRAIANR